MVRENPSTCRAVRGPARLTALAMVLFALVGCRAGGERISFRRPLSPVDAGYHTNNLLDLPSQADADALGNLNDLSRAAERIRRKPTLEQLARRQSVLCLSGGGSYGAFTAGVLCGWTASGERPGVNGRPNFSVVTGISTGALIAPFAFLGPQYDEAIRKFYTTVEDRDIYRLRPVRGLFSEALADNWPLAELIDRSLTPRMIQEVGEEHRRGRRLYIGTTELESGRFVCWDVGEIAARNGPGDRELIKQILLGSSAIPAFFPPSRIPVTVDGRTFVENHGDGGVSMPIFFRPPNVPPGERTNGNTDLAGVDLYLIVAGKLYADARPIRERSVRIGARSVSTLAYAQTRTELQRLYLQSVVHGMSYHLAAIPPEFPAPTGAADFDPAEMIALFQEGYGLAAAGLAWRSQPPGAAPGESMLQRSGTNLNQVPRAPARVER
jgi:predicted patatin/cPLA2 family phospholipase